MDGKISKITHHILFILLFLFIASGCALHPLDQAEVSFSEDTAFSLYVLDPNIDVKVQCYSVFTHQWSNLITITPSNNSFEVNGTTVYPASGKEKLFPCWFLESGDLYKATLRFKQGNNFLYVFDENGLDCFNDELAKGTSAANATLQCALKEPGGTGYAKTIEVWGNANP